MKSVSVIIPCYNDGLTIKSVIRAVKKSSLVSEIIIVNDGSDMITSKILNGLIGVKLINIAKNKGKAHAMWLGLKHSHSDCIIYLDADYQGLTSKHLHQLSLPVLSGSYDLVIGELEKDLTPFKLYGTAITLSGARGISRRLLLKHPEIFKSLGYVNGFLVESYMNKIFFRQYHTAKVNLIGLANNHKIFKIGLAGFFNDIKIISRILDVIGKDEVEFQTNYVRKLKYLN